MAKPEHLEILKQGAEAWNELRRHASHAMVFDLMGADLSDTNLMLADLGDVYLVEANLSGANLYGANLGCVAGITLR